MSDPTPNGKFTYVEKNPGDLIRSADWNAATKEVARLETAKVNRLGTDEIQGPLTVKEALTINSPVGIGKPAATDVQLTVAGKGGTHVDLVVNGRLRSDSDQGGLWISDDRFVGGHDTNKIGFLNNGQWRLSVEQDGAIAMGTTQNPTQLSVVGIANISNGNHFAVKNNYMANGSLTIGSTDTNYGGGNQWNDNTAGLLLEAKDNTEIAVHDSSKRIASLMYYEGDAANRVTIGRDMGWGGLTELKVNSSLNVVGVMSGPPNSYQKAQFTMSGGGTVTWSLESSTTGRLRWTDRFIAISMERSSDLPAGHINIRQPTENIPASQVHDNQVRSVNTNGVLLKHWEALYAVHTPGGDQTVVSFAIERYSSNFIAPSNWLLVAAFNSDDKTLKLGTGIMMAANSSSTMGSPIPTGVIMMWSGSANTIPYGWTLCNGQNGAPNLQDRFIVGAGSSYGVGSTGGANSVTLSVNQIPSHNHDNGSYKYLLRRTGTYTSKNTDSSANEPNLISSGAIRATGGGQAHENRPPYYALCYIMKL